MPSLTRRRMMQDDAAPVKALPTETNPFIDGLALVPKRKSGKVPLVGVSVLREDTGTVEPAFHDYTRLDDTEPFTKFYGAARERAECLNAPGVKVLMYAFACLLPGNSVVWLTAVEYRQRSGHSRASYYAGLNELLVGEWLAPTKQRGFFFINPAFFFNGNRIRMRHDFIKPKKSRTP